MAVLAATLGGSIEISIRGLQRHPHGVTAVWVNRNSAAIEVVQHGQRSRGRDLNKSSRRVRVVTAAKASTVEIPVRSQHQAIASLAFALRYSGQQREGSRCRDLVDRVAIQC